MTDGIIKGTGNSRNLRTVANALTLYPTYEDFITALVAGEFPIDLAGINPTGWQTVGDKLNKSVLLKDATAALYGKTASAKPDDILAAIRPLITTAQNTANGRAQIETGSYVGSGTNSKSLTFSFAPKIVIMLGYYRQGTYYTLFGNHNMYGSFVMSIEIKNNGGFKYGTNNESSASSGNISGKTVSWNNTNPIWALNQSDMTYYYLAIG